MVNKVPMKLKKMLLIWNAFQIKEEGRFSVWNIFFLLWRYLRFCIMQMRKVMTSLKHYNTQSRISLEILKQCSLNLAPETKIATERKWHPSCCCHDNSYAAGPVLIKTKIPRFYLKQGSSPPNNLMGRVKTIWEPCVFRVRPSVPL